MLLGFLTSEHENEIQISLFTSTGISAISIPLEQWQITYFVQA
jgi:hypothetical protein